MYLPPAFAEDDPSKLREVMERYSFAVLISGGEAGLIAGHLPLLFEAGGSPNGRLFGHMARANPQWRGVEGEVMAVFSGSHAYISPTWYEEAGTVPTWNYVAVHAYGTFHVVEDRDGLLDILRRSVATYERPMPAPWTFDGSDPKIASMLKAIVGFRVEITRLEGKWKLGQNQPEPLRERAIRALSDRRDPDSLAIAGLMRETLT